MKEFGTMEDFDELVAAARERGMGIMLDMVLCHTSNQHEWFQRALAGEERYQRYYILRDGKGSMGPGDPGEPPTSIVSVHSISAGPERAVWSMVLKPAVRVVTD